MWNLAQVPAEWIQAFEKYLGKNARKMISLIFIINTNGVLDF